MSRHWYCTAIAALLCLLPGYTIHSTTPISAKPGMIIINEVASTGNFDFVELKNITDETIIIDSSWYIHDLKEGIFDGDLPIELMKGTRIPPGGYITFAPYKSSRLINSVPKDIPVGVIPVLSFTLGGKDQVTLVYENTVVDLLQWDTGVNSLGRDPDYPDNPAVGGPQVITDTLQPTPNQDNKKEPFYSGDPLPIKINEICSVGIDYIELINTSTQDFIFEKDAWTLHDIGKKDRFTIPEATRIQGKSFLVIYPDLIRLPLSAPRNSLASTTGSRFGLSGKDSVFLRYHGEIVEQVSWVQHVSSKGRFPDGSDNWVEDLIMTPGKPNRK